MVRPQQNQPDYHRTENPQTTVEECRKSRDYSFIDVRSPKEFSDGSLPNAVNLPLLDDAERETVGIVYKRHGRDGAVERGYRILEPKLEGLKWRFSKISKNRTAIVYCARGGMRSQVVTSLMRSFGYRAKQLKGGYKAFRRWNLDLLERFEFTELIVLHGQTGVGKTLVLNRLPNSIDLEGIAGHRGSMFGGIGKCPATQKSFDSRLLDALENIDNTKPVFVEGESRKIGRVVIPNGIFRQMGQARNILLKASMHIRVQRTIKEYVTCQPTTIAEIRETIGRLKGDLGKKKVTNLLRLFEERNYRECFRTILDSYYDRKYSHGMKDLVCEKEIWADDLPAAVSEILRHSLSKGD